MADFGKMCTLEIFEISALSFTYFDDSVNRLYAILIAGCSRTFLNHPLTLYATLTVFCRCETVNTSGNSGTTDINGEPKDKNEKINNS